MRGSRAPATGGLLILALLGGPAGAQRNSALDVGISFVSFPDDSSEVIGPSVGWTSSVEGGRLFGQVAAGGVGTIGAATGSASAAGGARTSIARGWLVEGSGELFGVAGSSTRGAGTSTASGRLLRLIGRGGLWTGATGSLGWRESGSMPAASAEAGAWWGWPRARLSATFVEQHARAQLFTGPQRQRPIGTIPVQYAEGTVGLHVESDLASLDLSAGARRDPDAERLFEPVVTLTAAFWRSSTRAFTVSVSRQPADFVRGADATRWLALGMRFNEPTPATRRAARLKPLVQVSGEAATRVLRVRAPGAKRVELMADFTNWEPVVLSVTPSGFEHSAAIGVGTHRLLVRIDGGEWRPAANTPAVSDDLGGRVGLLVVP